MSPTLLAGSLFEHMRHICERPRMYAPRFQMDHLSLFVDGYEAALKDANLPSQHERFRDWLFRRQPEWKHSSLWWGDQVLERAGGDLDLALKEIVQLIDLFLAGEGREFVRFPQRIEP